MINAYWEGLKFDVPPVPEPEYEAWMRWIDTARESPDDISSWDTALAVTDTSYAVHPRSLVVLVSRLKSPGRR